MIDFRNPAHLAATIEVAKAQVRRDIAFGFVPATVACFAELHDYRDAVEVYNARALAACMIA